MFVSLTEHILQTRCNSKLTNEPDLYL